MEHLTRAFVVARELRRALIWDGVHKVAKALDTDPNVVVNWVLKKTDDELTTILENDEALLSKAGNLYA